MCAIVDAQVAHEVFSADPSPAGYEFFEWLLKGRGRLVTGGKLNEELEDCSPGFREWASEAKRAGILIEENRRRVEDRTIELEHDAKHVSDDPHVLALAQISGARLLFSNDRPLGKDFRSKLLIDDPRGRVYHTRDIKTLNDNKQFSKTHKRLLSDTRLCRASK